MNVERSNARSRSQLSKQETWKRLGCQAFFVLAVTLSETRATCTQTDATVRLKDCQCAADGGPVSDTQCWQDALQAATNGIVFGTVEATSGKTYHITQTLLLQNALGGVIDGNGASLEWWGTDPSVPMFLLEDTQRVTMRNLQIRSSVNNGGMKKLRTAIEFTNDPTTALVAPIGNIVEEVIIEGTDTGLDYGIRFSSRYCPPVDLLQCDQNNDQSTIRDVNIFNVNLAAISIEHPQSVHHRLLNVNASGAFEAVASIGVSAAGGSFSATGGHWQNFSDSVAYIGNLGPYVPVQLINLDSEASRMLLRTAGGIDGASPSVQIQGGRFAVENVVENPITTFAHVIEFHMRGPLVINGWHLDHVLPIGTRRPVIYFNSSFEGSLLVTGVQSRVKNSASWDLIVKPNSGTVFATGNLCGTDGDPATGGVTTVPCTGLGGGVLATTGILFAQLPTTLSNGHMAYCTDCRQDETTGVCSSGGSGATARREGNVWRCDGGELLPSAQQTVTNKNMTSSTNTFPGTSAFVFSTGSAAVTSTRWVAPNSPAFDTSQESKVSLPIATRLLVKGLYCKTSTATNSANKIWTMSLYKNGSSSGMPSCAISGSATSCTDTTTAVLLNPGDALSLKFNATTGGNAPPQAIVQCSLSATP